MRSFILSLFLISSACSPVPYTDKTTNVVDYDSEDSEYSSEESDSTGTTSAPPEDASSENTTTNSEQPAEDENNPDENNPDEIDQDGDGIFADEDCNDLNPSMPLEDADCDGVLAVNDCDDNNQYSTVIAEDADCDGIIAFFDCDDTDPQSIYDMDCDGYLSSEDCDDGNSSINPSASDLYSDGIDQDCDGIDGPASNCAWDEIPDCNGNCAPADWVGDGWCDDGYGFWGDHHIYFDCAQFNNDDGDC